MECVNAYEEYVNKTVADGNRRMWQSCHARMRSPTKPCLIRNWLAVCDISAERAQAFGKKFEVKGYTDLAEMLEREKVDVLSICTQHTQHPVAVETAAAAGVHVISEKPLAVDLESCNRAIAAARAAGVKLGVVSQRRWYEPVQRMKEAIDAGKLGKPCLVMVRCLGGASPLITNRIPGAERGRVKAAE